MAATVRGEKRAGRLVSSGCLGRKIRGLLDSLKSKESAPMFPLTPTQATTTTATGTTGAVENRCRPHCCVVPLLRMHIPGLSLSASEPGWTVFRQRRGARAARADRKPPPPHLVEVHLQRVHVLLELPVVLPPVRPGLLRRQQHPSPIFLQVLRWVTCKRRKTTRTRGPGTRTQAHARKRKRDTGR